VEETSLQTLEGRLLAQRRILALTIASLPDTSAARNYLRDRSQFVDNEEDPGVLPSEAFSIEAALAEEFRLIAEEVERQTGGGARQDPRSTEAATPRRAADTSSPGAAQPWTPSAAENICRRCGGSGRDGSAPCPECGGTGRVNTPVGGTG